MIDPVRQEVIALAHTVVVKVGTNVLTDPAGALAPARIQALAQRHLALKPIDPTQIDSLDRLPARPPSPAAPAAPVSAHDPVAVILDGIEGDMPTGSIGTVEIASPATAPGEAR